MLSTIWNSILVDPLFNILVGFFNLTGSLGVSIILLTLLIRFILLPITLPSIEAMKKQKDLKPELDKIKKKYKYDKKKQAEMQMELFRKHNLNPISGCLPQILTMFVLIALYSVIRRFSIDIDVSELNTHIYFEFLKIKSSTIDTSFLIWDLAQKDRFFVMGLVSGVVQFFASKMMMPYNKVGEKLADQTPDKTDDFAYNMQQQMLYTMPVITFFIGVTVPSGLALYIMVTTVFSLFMNYFVYGSESMKAAVESINFTKKLPKNIK